MIQNGYFTKFLSILENDGIQTNSANVYIGYLTAIVKAGANLLDTESVKAAIAKKPTWNNKTKTLAAASYSKYLDVMGGSWKVPRFKAETPLPYIATESEINSLIDAANKKLSTYLLLLKETGMRSAEAWGLKWADVDFERGGLTLNDTKKHGTPRGFKVSPRLIAMLNALPKHSKTWIFQNKTDTAWLIHFAAAFRFFRNTLSVKLQKPNLLKISFHSFRHWFATMEYNKTKNLLHVQERLGHKNILNTVIYTHLVNFESDAYNTAAALDVAEARKLVEAGFEFPSFSHI
jgi:integrase